MMYVRFLSDYMTTITGTITWVDTSFFEKPESFYASLFLLKHPFISNSADKRPRKYIVIYFLTEDERVWQEMGRETEHSHGSIC